MSSDTQSREAFRYIRDKIDQMLSLMGTLPLRPEELDDATLISLDPIGIIVDSFAQVLEHLKETNHQLLLSQNEIRTILDSADASIVVYDAQWRIEDCNSQALTKLFSAHPREAVIGAPMREISPSQGRIEHSVWDSPSKQAEFQHNEQWFSVRATAVTDEHGQIDKMVYLYADMTAQRKALDELMIYEKVFDNTDEGILVTDASQVILMVNRAFGEITQYDHREVPGSRPVILKSHLHNDNFYRDMWKCIRENGFWRGEILDRRQDGSLLPLWQTISEVRDESGEVCNYISVINDISSLRQAQIKLDYLAYHDPLTDLPNRLLLQDRMTQALLRSERDGQVNAVLFIDLDRFKLINDSLGHLVGDRLLQMVAKRILSVARNADTVARLGGDEFVILLEDIGSREEATRMADRVIDVLKESMTLDGHELHVGCSIGISMSPDDGVDSVTLLKNADTAMYRVKESGRDGYHIYSAELSTEAEQRLLIEAALRKGIQDERFYLVYQPIVDAQDGRVRAAEALARWRCPSMGEVPPARFIPIAEESNLIIVLGRRIIELAVRQWLRWREQGIALEYLSVNVSGPQLYSERFANELIALLQRHQIEGCSLQLEITENVLMSDLDACIRQLQRLRDYGIRIAIDDFGTGYSSLSYLSRLPLDIIKVDRSFISSLPADRNDAAIARTIIGLTHSLEFGSVAEGIETTEQRDYMMQLGCECFQGYLFSRPLDEAAFAEYWMNHRA